MPVKHRLKYHRKIALKTIFQLVLVFSIAGAVFITARTASNRSQSQDIRSQATEETTKTYPQSVQCLNENLACQISGDTPTNTVVGLYAPIGASCDTKKHCEKIDTRYVTSCAVYDFGNTYNKPVIIKYAQTQQPIAGDSCVDKYCGTFPGFVVFTSQDKQTWQVAASLSETPAETYTEKEIKFGQVFRFIMACRGGSGHGRDNIIVDQIYLESSLPNPTISPQPSSIPQDPIDVKAKEFIEKIINRDLIDHYKTSFAGLGMACSTFNGAYKKFGGQELLNKSAAMGDYLIAKKDLNKDGKIGWGLFDAKDAFGDDTTNPAHTEYMFQTGRAINCLAELYELTKKSEYLNTAKQAIDDSWNKGTSSLDVCPGCYYYWYSYHPNDFNRYVRNTNIEMAEALAWLYKITGDDKYKTRAMAILKAEMNELKNKNYGYLGIYDPKYKANPGTESIRTEDHYPSQAIYLYEIVKLLNLNLSDYKAKIEDYFNKWENCTAYFCNRENLDCITSAWTGDINQCTNTYTFYFCHVRSVSAKLHDKCLHEINEVKSLTLPQAWSVMTGY